VAGVLRCVAPDGGWCSGWEGVAARPALRGRPRLRLVVLVVGVLAF